MRIRKLIILLSVIVTFSFIFQKGEKEPIENLLIEPGIGFDVKTAAGKIEQYNLTVTGYSFNEDKITELNYTAKGRNIGETREIRQRKLDKRFILGFEKVYVFSEDYAKLGISDVLDLLLKNPWVNDDGYVVVCKGKAEDIIKLKIPGYSSSSDFLDGLVYSSRAYNFFPKKFALVNLYKYMDAEGKQVTVPYIDIREGKIEITALAVFKKNKMVAKLNPSELKLLNLLRESGVRGIFNIQQTDKNYVSFETESKRKATCQKINENYVFNIKLNLTGDVVCNELYENMMNTSSRQKEFGKDMEEKLKIDLRKFIQKMQSEYKMDMLNLGSLAAAKYGRHSGTNWDEVVSNADIKVDVKVKVDRFGRGDY